MKDQKKLIAIITSAVINYINLNKQNYTLKRYFTKRKLISGKPLYFKPNLYGWPLSTSV